VAARSRSRAGLAQTIPVSTHLLGCDIADSGLTSALSNCGLVSESDQPAAMRAQWAPLMNEHGLFEDVKAAEEFRALSDTRVPEHAPFLVHALHLVKW